MRFNEMNLSTEVLRAIEDCGYTEATYIQKACIPSILCKADVIGQSQTGTGKTAAFAIPLVEMLEADETKKPKALILSPTRELALQVTEEIRKFMKYKEGLRTVCIYGGQPINKQIIDLKKGADIVVGTPGRILDHIDRHTLKFQECSLLVLDEADEMLNMGFREDIEKIIRYLPEQRQTILFSATMPQPILEITKQYQNNPVHIKSAEKHLTASTIRQIGYECNQSDKLIVLIQLVQMMNPGLSMIFCNTKKMVDDLVGELVARGYPAVGLHGDMKQEMRSLVMDKFKSRKITMLVATDVAARGIDVDSMDVVFNYDLPQENEYYVHRIGRTGRAGKEGVAVTLYTPRQRNKLKEIEVLSKCKVERKELPSKTDMRQFHMEHIKSQVLDFLTKPVPEEMQYLMDEIIMEGYTAEDIAKALLFKQAGNELFTEIKKPKEPNSKKARKSSEIARLLLDVGKRHEIAAAHVVSAIAEASGIRGKDIGRIEINDRDTLVEIPLEFAADILESLNKTTIRGYAVHGLLLDTVKAKKKKNSSDTDKSVNHSKSRNSNRSKPSKKEKKTAQRKQKNSKKR